MPTITATEPRIVTPAQYETLMAPPPVHTISEFLEGFIAFWVGAEMGIESELRRLAQLIPTDLVVTPGRFPFVVVPARPDPIDWAKFMRLVVHNSKHGVNYLNPAYLADEVAVPTGPYLMLDVEDGRGRLSVKPSVSQNDIIDEGRSPYVTFEGLSHAAVLPVLGHHNCWLCGSRYGSKDTPGLFLVGGEPKLDAYWSGGAVPGWGAPSCGRRVGL